MLNRVFRFRPVRGAQAGPALGHPVPRLPHRPLPRALRRLRLDRGLRADHRRCRASSSPATQSRSSASSNGACATPRRTSASRKPRASQPALLDPHLAERQAGTGATRRRRRARARARRRPRRRADLPAARRQVIDRFSFHLENVEAQDVTAVLESFCVEYYGRRRRCRRRSSCRRRPGTSRRSSRSSPTAAGRAWKSAGRCAARSAGSRSLRGQRAAGARVGEGGRRRRAARAGRGDRGAPRGAQPRVAAAADRVLRHLDDPGRRDGGSMVVFEDAAPKKAHYRKFAVARSTVRTTSLQWRRWCHAASRGSAGDAPRLRRVVLRDAGLVVIDGGKGQLSAALAAMQEYDLPASP